MNYKVGSRYPKPGDKVKIAQKKDYASGVLTEGTVKDVLTSKQFHPRGHKVRLTSGIIGRVHGFIDQPKQEPATPPALTAPYTSSEDDLV